jgi:hypothetical protein
MSFKALIDFILKKMSMSHVYQPILIKALVQAGGKATIRQLAQTLLLEDESQLIFYEKRLKEMPLKVLKKHGVLTVDGDLVSINVEDLSLEQRAEIRGACEDRLMSFVSKRGITTWDYRMLEDDPVSDSVRYRLLKKANGRCSLCGATKKETVLHVDHIVPRSRGGTNDESNLQVLCLKCNLGKSNKDATDFRT